MNTHDIDIELPPLPYPQIPGNDYTAKDMHDYARAHEKAVVAALQSQDREDVLVQGIQEAIALLGPEAPSCSGCEYEWNHALRALREAIDRARYGNTQQEK